MKKLNKIPDAMFSGSHGNFTMINNEILRNPKLSSKAKTILSLLLSNKRGWKTYVKTLAKFMKEGKTSITSGIKELKEFGYLIRISYRDKVTKKMKGSFIAYTQEPFTFDLEYNKELLEMYNCELVLKKEKNRTIEKPTYRKTVGSENRALIILNNNNIDISKDISLSDTKKTKNNNSSMETNNTNSIQKKQNIKSDPEYKTYNNISIRLAEIISTHRKRNCNSDIKSWVNPIRLLMTKDLSVPGSTFQGIKKRVNAVLDFYEENIGCEYISEAFSGTAFRKKFFNLESAMEKAKKKQNGYTKSNKYSGSNGNRATEEHLKSYRKNLIVIDE